MGNLRLLVIMPLSSYHVAFTQIWECLDVGKGNGISEKTILRTVVQFCVGQNYTAKKLIGFQPLSNLTQGNRCQ